MPLQVFRLPSRDDKLTSKSHLNISPHLLNLELCDSELGRNHSLPTTRKSFFPPPLSRSLSPSSSFFTPSVAQEHHDSLDGMPVDDDEGPPSMLHHSSTICLDPTGPPCPMFNVATPPISLPSLNFSSCPVSDTALAYTPAAPRPIRSTNTANDCSHFAVINFRRADDEAIPFPVAPRDCVSLDALTTPLPLSLSPSQFGPRSPQPFADASSSDQRRRCVAPKSTANRRINKQHDNSFISGTPSEIIDTSGRNGGSTPCYSNLTPLQQSFSKLNQQISTDDPRISDSDEKEHVSYYTSTISPSRLFARFVRRWRGSPFSQEPRSTSPLSTSALTTVSDISAIPTTSRFVQHKSAANLSATTIPPFPKFTCHTPLSANRRQLAVSPVQQEMSRKSQPSEPPQVPTTTTPVFSKRGCAVDSSIAIQLATGLAMRTWRLKKCKWDILYGMFIFISFLTMHFVNGRFRILPGLEDVGTVGINTIFRLEAISLGFHPASMLADMANPLLDVLACIPYLCHYLIPLGFPIYLFATNRVSDISRFYWLIGCSNWLLFVAWWLFPTAPPWAMNRIVAAVGSSVAPESPFLRERFTRLLSSHPDVSLINLFHHREGSAFARLDSRAGLSFFYTLFAGNTVPFAAFPSGHLAWTTVVYVVGAPGGNYFGIYVLWLAWATMYSHHHYLIDAIAGISVVYACDFALRLVSQSYRINVSCPRSPLFTKSWWLKFARSSLRGGKEFSDNFNFTNEAILPQSAAVECDRLLSDVGSSSPSKSRCCKLPLQQGRQTTTPPRTSLMLSEDFPPADWGNQAEAFDEWDGLCGERNGLGVVQQQVMSAGQRWAPPRACCGLNDAGGNRCNGGDESISLVCGASGSSDDEDESVVISFLDAGEKVAKIRKNWTRTKSDGSDCLAALGGDVWTSTRASTEEEDVE